MPLTTSGSGSGGGGSGGGGSSGSSGSSGRTGDHESGASVKVTSSATESNDEEVESGWYRGSSALPFWAGCGLLLSTFPLFFVPAWDQTLYYGNIGLSYSEYYYGVGFATWGFMFSHPPGRVADRYGERACALVGAVISAVAYLVLSLGWGGYYSLPALALYGLAFLVGHGACWLKVAVLSTAVHALGLGLEGEFKPNAARRKTTTTAATERCAGEAFGLLYGCFEFSANLYAQVTEVWCAWGCSMGFNDTAMIAGRHLVVPIVAVLLSPGLYRPSAAGLPTADRDAVKLTVLNFAFIVLVLGAMVNWYDQSGWCYTTIFAWLKPSKHVNLEEDIIDCWIPSFEWLLWGMAVTAAISLTAVATAMLPRMATSWLGLQRHSDTAGRSGVSGGPGTGGATGATGGAGGDADERKGDSAGAWGSAGGGLLDVDRGLTTTTRIFGGDIASSPSDGESPNRNNGLLEDGLLLDGVLSTFIHDNSAESNHFFNRQAKRRERRVAVCLAVLVGCVLGTGQSIGNQYWTIAEAYKGDDNFFLAHRAASGFLFPRMVSSVIVGMLWDLRVDYGAAAESFASSPPGASSFERIGSAWVAMRVRSADGPHKGVSLHGDILVVLSVTMLVANVLFAAFSDSLLGVVWGFMLSGFATGAMNSLVPCLALEWFGRVRFLSKYSFLMTAAIVGNLLSYAVIEHTDYLLTHRPDEDKDTASFDTYEANDDAAELSLVLDADWGGCVQKDCYCVAFWIQSGLMCAAVCAAAALRSEYQRLSDGEALRDIDDADGASVCVQACGVMAGGDSSSRSRHPEEAPLIRPLLGGRRQGGSTAR